jgi:gas vesicle protein
MEETKVNVKPRSMWRSLFWGVMVGSLVGGTAALLTAPHSGPETLGMINQRVGEVKNRINDVKTDLQIRAQNVAKAAQGQIE